MGKFELMEHTRKIIDLVDPAFTDVPDVLDLIVLNKAITLNHRNVKKDDNDVSVTREDQGMINAFSRHNAHHVEITDKLSELKKQLENINEAKEELELQIEDDKVPLKIGEVFVHFEQDDTAPYLDQLVEKMEKQVRQLEAEASSTKEKMNGLKGRLYAKFGNSINLEADDSK